MRRNLEKYCCLKKNGTKWKNCIVEFFLVKFLFHCSKINDVAGSAKDLIGLALQK